MKDAKSLIRFDNDTQAVEIALHLKINVLSEEDTSEKTKWIQNCGRGLRGTLAMEDLLYWLNSSRPQLRPTLEGMSTLSS